MCYVIASPRLACRGYWLEKTSTCAPYFTARRQLQPLPLQPRYPEWALCWSHPRAAVLAAARKSELKIHVGEFILLFV